MSEEPRRLREDEVQAILARASSQDKRANLPAPHDPTVADLMAAAEEVGLDPADVRRAASLVPFQGGGVAPALLGAPDRRHVLVVLDGLAVPSDRHATARAVERAVGRAGTLEKHGRSPFHWRSRDLSGGVDVTMAQVGNSMEVRVAADRAGLLAGLWFVGLLAWAALSALTPLGSLPVLAKVAGFILAPLAVARPFWKISDRRLEGQLEGWALEVARAAEELAVQEATREKGPMDPA